MKIILSLLIVITLSCTTSMKHDHKEKSPIPEDTSDNDGLKLEHRPGHITESNTYKEIQVNGEKLYLQEVEYIFLDGTMNAYQKAFLDTSQISLNERIPKGSMVLIDYIRFYENSSGVDYIINYIPEGHILLANNNLSKLISDDFAENDKEFFDVIESVHNKNDINKIKKYVLKKDKIKRQSSPNMEEYNEVKNVMLSHRSIDISLYNNITDFKFTRKVIPIKATHNFVVREIKILGITYKFVLSPIKL